MEAFRFTRHELVSIGATAIVELVLLVIIQAVAPLLFAEPLRSVAILALSAIALIGGFVVVIRWIDRDRRNLAIQSPQLETVQLPYGMGPVQIPAPTITQEPTEDRAIKEIRAREGILHTALDTVITWLYRRANWEGLSQDGRHSEPAPWDIWAKGKYAELGLNRVAYQPPKIVGAEPGFHPGVTEAKADAATGVGRAFNARGVVSYPKPGVIHDAPEDVQNQHLASFCAQRQPLIEAGKVLVTELWRLSDTAGPTDQTHWEHQVRNWRGQTKAHRQKWWANDPSHPKPGKSPALHPAWRGALISLVQGELDWFDWHGTACGDK